MPSSIFSTRQFVTAKGPICITLRLLIILRPIQRHFCACFARSMPPPSLRSCFHRLAHSMLLTLLVVQMPTETKANAEGDDELEREREGESVLSALALPSATGADGNEELGRISRASESSENSETPSGTKRRTSFLGRY